MLYNLATYSESGFNTSNVPVLFFVKRLNFFISTENYIFRSQSCFRIVIQLSRSGTAESRSSVFDTSNAKVYALVVAVSLENLDTSNYSASFLLFFSVF